MKDRELNLTEVEKRVRQAEGMPLESYKMSKNENDGEEEGN